MTPEKQEIDVVVLWVDGDAPELVRKREAYQTGAMEELHEDVGGKTRYANLMRCSISVFRYRLRNHYVF